MKFRGKMTLASEIRIFANLIYNLHKFAKLMILRVRPEKIAFLLTERASSGAGAGKDKDTTVYGAVGNAAVAWCEFRYDYYFTDFSMEGVSPEFNEIYMELGADLFSSSLSSLRTSQNVTSLKMKLTRKVVPCLTLEIETVTGSMPVNLTHDIPVTIIPRKNWSGYQHPEPPPFHVSMHMPEIKFLRLSMERMRSISSKINFMMGKNGKLILSVGTYSVQCTVTFQDLIVVDLSDEDDQQRRPQSPIVQAEESTYTIEVDLKSIIHLLPTDGAKPSSVICSMADSRMLHWLMNFEGVQIEYFVPGSAAV